MKLMTVNALKIGARLSDLVRELPLGINPNLDRVGFWLTFARREHRGVIIPEFAQAPVGADPILNPYGSVSIQLYSAEKALRLAAHRLRDQSAISSWQTANPRLEMYQGAVAFPLDNGGFHIVSVSAYKEPVDEAVALLIGREMGFGDNGFIQKVVEESDNQAYPYLQEAYDRDSS